MNDKEIKAEDISTTSTSESSPTTEKLINDGLNIDKAKEYESKIQKLTEFVVKLKSALEKKSAECEQKNKEIEIRKKEYSDLHALYEKFINDEAHKTVDLSKLIKVTCRIKIDAVIWVLLRFEDKLEWYREEVVLSSSQDNKDKYQKLINGDLIDPAEKENFEKAKKELKNQLEETIKQYEGRLQKIQSQWEISEKKNQELRELNKSLSKANDSKQGEFSELISGIIEESVEIRERCLIYLNSETDENSKYEAMNKIKISISGLQKKSYQHEFNSLNELKTHILLLHQTLYDSLKQLGNAQAESLQLDKAWKRSWETISTELEKEKKDKQEIIDMGRKKIKDLENQLEYVKMETAKYLKEKDLKIDFLNKELKKNVNVEYIRNIIYNFITNHDFSVREKLIPVIGTVLQFSATEIENAKQAWDKEQKSVIVKGTQWINDKLKKSPNMPLDNKQQ